MGACKALSDNEALVREVGEDIVSCGQHEFLCQRACLFPVSRPQPTGLRPHHQSEAAPEERADLPHSQKQCSGMCRRSRHGQEASGP